MSRILLCDDSPPVLDHGATLLRAAGYEVVTADSGADAVVKLMEKPPPDLVILDVKMPNGGAGAVLDSLGPTAPPVILMTGADTEGLDLTHVRAVLTKPCPVEKLMATIAHVLTPEACP